MSNLMAAGWSRGSGHGRREAFTLIEVLVVVAILALLVALLLPSLAKSRELAKRTVCAGRFHNLALAVHAYAHDNKGKIIQCRYQQVQVALNPRLVSPSTTGAYAEDYVDWWSAARRYQLDKELWECPNRPGIFSYEGTPTESVQGYTAASLRGRGYRVTEATSGAEFTGDQWIIGIQYFGGIKKWETLVPNPSASDGLWPSRSPLDSSAKPSWALAADSVMKVDGGWGRGRPNVFGLIPPHPDPDGKPAGSNVLTFDGATAWIHRSRLVAIHSWNPTDREAYWWQADMGPYGKRLHDLGIRPGIR